MATASWKACYIPISHKDMQAVNNDLFSEPISSSSELKQLSAEVLKKYLLPLFTNKSILKIGHNAKFDMHFLAQIFGEDAEIFPLDDTCVMSYDLDSSEHGHSLDELSELFLAHKMISYEEVCGSGKNKITIVVFDYRGKKVVPSGSCRRMAHGNFDAVHQIDILA